VIWRNIGEIWKKVETILKSYEVNPEE